MGAAVDGGVALLVEVLLGFEHRAGVLARCPRVEVDEGMPVDFQVKHREVVAEAGDLGVVQRGLGGDEGRGRLDQGHGAGLLRWNEAAFAAG
ncbi:hypothetical protein SCMU_12980 [Sinomonas cyclohexanicum]|uniref:Uncharacterized protein n=1 Tax=Sinomonas cyclohexanicum TaxID=322009 RepID=A0ABM7PT84_SINCY|nr:hypothetical protein SCMU_12980 [Corynebacterium cyclohexanicum]